MDMDEHTPTPAAAGPDAPLDLTSLARRFWDADARRKLASGQPDDPVLLGTVSDNPPLVRLRDRLEKACLRRAVRWDRRTRVLDLGGGAGRLALWLAPQVAEVVLVDASAEMIAAARREAERRGIGNVRCIHTPMLEYRPEGRFDLVLVFAVATYLRDVELRPLARLCAGALAPGGRVVLKEPVTVDGRRRADTRRDEQGNLVYHAHFRPREDYPAAFAGELICQYQQPTCAHLIPRFLGGTQQAVDAAGRSGMANLVERLSPLLVALDPSLQRLEELWRGHAQFAGLLAPVPVLQELYVFSVPGEGAQEAQGPLPLERDRPARAEEPASGHGHEKRSAAGVEHCEQATGAKEQQAGQPETGAEPGEPALSVVVIAYNEQECLAPVVQELGQALDAAKIDYELVLVDDGSTDRTPELMQRLAASDPRIRVLRQPNLGIGGALRTGFDAARGRHVTWIPADGQIAPTVVLDLFRRRDEAPMLTTVYRTREDPWYRTAISRTLNALIRLRTGQVAKSGGSYLFERRVWQELGPHGDDTMMISTAFRQRLREEGVRIVEVEIDCRARRGGRSKVLNARVIGSTLAGLVAMAPRPSKKR